MVPSNKIGNYTQPKERLEKMAFILKTIAHPTRLAVIDLLDKNIRMSVNEMCDETGCEQSLLSHHLNNMKIKGLLKAEKNGQNVFYSLKENELSKILACVENCNCHI